MSPFETITVIWFLKLNRGQVHVQSSILWGILCCPPKISNGHADIETHGWAPDGFGTHSLTNLFLARVAMADADFVAFAALIGFAAGALTAHAFHRARARPADAVSFGSEMGKANVGLEQDGDVSQIEGSSDESDVDVRRRRGQEPTEAEHPFARLTKSDRVFVPRGGVREVYHVNKNCGQLKGPTKPLSPCTFCSVCRG